ncbi:MAG: hypothetical protein IJ736_07470 [Firmicutes bacterium]|nr:hypothetical protein [Bacillota bacterium]
MSDIHDYTDIIDFPHHISKFHPHMTMTERAAQFSPFAALTGHAQAISETEKLVSAEYESVDSPEQFSE